MYIPTEIQALESQDHSLLDCYISYIQVHNRCLINIYRTNELCKWLWYASYVLGEWHKQGNRSLHFNALTGMIEVCTGCLEEKKEEEEEAKNPVWRLSEDTWRRQGSELSHKNQIEMHQTEVEAW